MRIKALILLVFTLVTIFPRVLDLDRPRSPDEKRWLANTSGFTRKLAHGQWGELVQQPHPGITTQWLGALTIRYQDSFSLQRLPVVLGQILLIFLIFYILSRLWSFQTAALAILFLAINPLLYAHSRVYAMDSLLALFALLSLCLLLLWHKNNQTRYLIFAGLTATAATLSKLPGIVMAPYSLLIILANKTNLLKNLSLYLLAFLVGFAIILPSFAINPLSVIGDFTELFRSDDYQELHQFGNLYYLRSLIFFSVPLHLLALVTLFWVWPKLNKTTKQHLYYLLTFAVLFIIMMTLGAKKGDRYILPAFVIFDALSALVLLSPFSLSANWHKEKVPTGRMRVGFALAILAFSLWQYAIIWRIHPQSLAYINPITQVFFSDQRHGWGEGLDLAADYLNQKPNSEQLKVASYYPNEFGFYFNGETVPAHKHEEGSIDYVILYRAMFDRGQDSYEQDVLNFYADKTLEKIIKINNLEMVWIYPTTTAN